ncbi:MAG TPA: hypothetical protein VF368_07875 [Gemmatimonadaceae bacterium]
MNPVLIARIALAVAGIVVWGLGARMDNGQLRWTGIGLLALSLLLRFAKGRPNR